ncbi:MAG: alkaline phosphatase family protein, partial [Gammaproteobacteria bacterium]|nr:alkaline phosphatase family protein [Gammaproteobacteria bacterium]
KPLIGRRAKRLAKTLLVLLGALAIGTANAASSGTVVLISMDGVRHDFLDATPLPASERMQREGARAERLIPVYPSNTFPGHVSIATGTWPDVHGIIDNHFEDAEHGVYRYNGDADWIKAEPLWAAAERQGVPAATYFWVGSETDWNGIGARHRMTPFDPNRPETEKAGQVLRWLRLPKTQRPRLIMSYWAGVDSVAHRQGPADPAVAAQLRLQDAALRHLLAGIDAMDRWHTLTLLVVSDHGMTVAGELIDAAAALADAGVKARVLGSAVANVYLEDAQDLEAATAALAGLNNVRARQRADIPAAWRLRHDGRTGDLVATTVPPFVLSPPSNPLCALMPSRCLSPGNHGYSPDHPDMGGILLALGRGVQAGARLPPAHQTDIAATVARLLGITPPAQSEGTPIAGIGG